MIGFEAGLSDSNADCKNAFGAGVDGSVGRSIDVTARAGALLSPTSLLYARGGYSNARFGSDGDGENRDGWLVGAGYETMLGANLSARVEYNYAKYSGYDDADGGVSIRLSPRRNVVKAGLAFRF